MVSNCCQSDCIETEHEWICRSCGAKAFKRDVDITRVTNGHLLNTIRVLRAQSPIGTTFKTTPERRRRWLNAMANEAYARGLELDPLTDNELVHE